MLPTSVDERLSFWRMQTFVYWLMENHSGVCCTQTGQGGLNLRVRSMFYLRAPNELNTCIKMRRFLVPQQSLFISYTRDFHMERKYFLTNRCMSRTMVCNVPDLVALNN
uniref:Uncharacterized protein n=1 Tax=Opuntia streptacantha TaxID=393608 RepID=A0A7C8YZP7_OPUST